MSQKAFGRALAIGVFATFSGALIQLAIMPLVSRQIGVERLNEFVGLLAVATLLSTPAFGLFPTLLGAWKSGRLPLSQAEQERVVLQLTGFALLAVLLVQVVALLAAPVVWPHFSILEVAVAIFLGSLAMVPAPLEALQAYRGQIQVQYLRTVLANSAIIAALLVLMKAGSLSVLALLGIFLGVRLVASFWNVASILRTLSANVRDCFRQERTSALTLGSESLQYTITNSVGSWLAHSSLVLILSGKLSPVALGVLGTSMLLVPSWNNAVNIVMRTVQSHAPEVRDQAHLSSHRRMVRRSLAVVGLLGGVPILAFWLVGPWYYGRAFGMDLSQLAHGMFLLVGFYCALIGLEEACFGAAVTLTSARKLALVRLAKGLVVSGTVFVASWLGNASEMIVWGTLLVTALAATLTYYFWFENSCRRRQATFS